MRQRKQVILAGLLLTAAWMSHASAQRGAIAGAALFEGARLITGDGGAAIEDSAFLVENAHFTRIGRRGEVPAPAGAARVDLTGKTVIPALVDGHSHIGYMKNLTSGAANYTRENILDHMYRFAYFGVAASQSMGSDFGELPFQLRDEIVAGKYPDAARFLTAGRGLSPIDEISPDNMRQAANPATTPEGARALGAGARAAAREGRSRPGSTTAAARSRSCRRRSTGPSSTRRTRTTCVSPSTRPASRTPRSCCAPASTSSRT